MCVAESEPEPETEDTACGLAVRAVHWFAPASDHTWDSAENPSGLSTGEKERGPSDEEASRASPPMTCSPWLATPPTARQRRRPGSVSSSCQDMTRGFDGFRMPRQARLLGP